MHFEEGLNELHELELSYAQSTSLNVGFERGWIDTALLMAYKRKGDGERITRYAVKIAEQLVVTHALAEGSIRSSPSAEESSRLAPENESYDLYRGGEPEE